MASRRDGGAAGKLDKVVAKHATPHWPVFASLALLLVFSFANLIITSGMNSYFSDRLSPAKLDIVAISASAGPEPSPGSSQFVSELKALGNVKILSEQSVSYPSDTLAGELVGKYGIKKLPAIVLTGELEKLSSFLGGLGWTGGTSWFVYEAQKPPYFDTASGKTLGLVKVVKITDPGCADCFNLGILEEALESSGVAISESQTYSYSEQKGAELISKYNITRVPALILSSDFSEYSTLASGWNQMGSVEGDGSYVLRKVMPPYMDVSTKNILGRVRLVELVDASCTGCYDVGLHRSIMQRFGLANFTSVEKHDVNSTKGAELLSKYDITRVPIILLSPEASAYEPLGQAWRQVGSVEADGWYVFRKPEVMGAYKNITSGEAVEPAAK